MGVVVLDRHRMVGQAIAGVLSEVAGLDVMGVCASVQEAKLLIRRHPPRLLVLDVELGDGSYCEAADLLLQLRPDAELLVVTAMAEAFSPPADLARCVIAVVDKALAWDQLMAVVLAWKDRCQNQVRTHLPSCQDLLSAIERLSPREQRVVRALGCGLLNKEIASRLNLSNATVETYRKHVAARLGVSGAELVRLASLYRMLSWDASRSS
ncbi:response regulator transcription factor [Synechococcus sp. CB0101]|nr:response regulator transcription factor [Synechococcus sp. CB0101]